MILLLLAALQDCDGLVRRLGDDDLAEREKAAVELRSAGARAMPALRRAAASPEVEIAGRAKAVIAAIERDDRVRRAIPAPARITLNTRGLTYRAVLDDIRKQTGLALPAIDALRVVEPVAAPVVDVKDASLGESLLALGLGFALDTKGEAWVHLSSPAVSHRQVRGPLELRLSLRKGSASIHHVVEPGHAVRALAVEITDARDPDGHAAAFGLSRTVLAPQSGFGWGADVPEKLGSLRIRATLIYAVETQTVRVAPKEEEATEEVAGFTFTHRRRNSTPPEVVLQIRPVAPGPDAELRLDALRSARPVLRGPDKSVVAARVSGPTRMTVESPAGVDRYRYFTLEREKESDPWDIRALEIEMPVDVEARSYEFEFKDVVRRDD